MKNIIYMDAMCRNIIVLFLAFILFKPYEDQKQYNRLTKKNFREISCNFSGPRWKDNVKIWHWQTLSRQVFNLLPRIIRCRIEYSMHEWSRWLKKESTGGGCSAGEEIDMSQQQHHAREFHIIAEERKKKRMSDSSPRCSHSAQAEIKTFTGK